MVNVPQAHLICEYLTEQGDRRVHVKEVADRFNLFTHAASLRMSECGWYPVGGGYWSKSGRCEPPTSDPI